MANKLTSADRIGQLLGKGWTKAEVARGLGINSSTVTQVLKGAKPGANLAGPLATLARRNTPASSAAIKPVAVTRRVGAGGQAVKVRTSGKAENSSGLAMVRSTAGRTNIMRELEKAARQGKGVSFIVTLRTITNYHGDGEAQKGAEIDLFKKGGMNAERFLDDVRQNLPANANAAQIKEALDAALLDAILNLPNVEDAAGVRRVEMTIFNRK